MQWMVLVAIALVLGVPGVSTVRVPVGLGNSRYLGSPFRLPATLRAPKTKMVLHVGSNKYTIPITSKTGTSIPELHVTVPSGLVPKTTQGGGNARLKIAAAAVMGGLAGFGAGFGVSELTDDEYDSVNRAITDIVSP